MKKKQCQIVKKAISFLNYVIILQFFYNIKIRHFVTVAMMNREFENCIKNIELLQSLRTKTDNF